MRPAKPGADDTVRILRPSRAKRAVWPLAAAVAGCVVVLAGSATFWLLRPSSAPPPSAVVAVAPAQAPVAPAPIFAITAATEEEIRQHVPSELSVFRFADNPQILVLDFASLHEQGKMLNRIAAFTEKAGLPHDRVLTDAELDAAIRARGDTVETFYFGHDYAANALVRFFATADGQRIELDPQEEKLRALLLQVGWLTPDVVGGLISLPAVGTDPRVTPATRAAILRHELSHGEFFSNPAYAEYVHNFWLREMSGEERANVRKFLSKDEYDVREEELMYNEMQAYLMFTRDPSLFRADMAGLTPARLAELQARFLTGMPAGWLRNLLAGYQSSTAAR